MQRSDSSKPEVKVWVRLACVRGFNGQLLVVREELIVQS